MSLSKHSCYTVRSFVLLATVLSLFCTRAVAQSPTSTVKPYRELEVDDSQRRKNRFRVTKILLAGRFANDADKKLVEQFYTTYAMARWTLQDNRAKLPEFRKELGNHLRTCGTGERPSQVHDYLNTIVLKYMADLSKGDYRPAVRVNAMLMIGELNAGESATTSVLPVPLSEAVPVLTSAIEANDQIDAVKVAAMVGLQRHCALGTIKSDQAKAAVLKAVLGLLNARRPAERTAAGDGWMRAQAAGILGMLETTGNGNVVVTSLGKLVADRTLPISTRCAAAEAVGKLNYRGAGGTNFEPVAVALGKLATDACAAEKEPISRRRLKGRLYAVDLGLTQLGTVAGVPEIVAKLKGSITTMLGLIEDRKLAPNTMMERINQEASKLKALLSS